MQYKGKRLTNKVLETIIKQWPIHPSGICRHLNIEVTASNISKINYHFRVLEEKGFIHTKQIDRAVVAWPAEIDKIRMVHQMIQDI
ncbi:MAG: hypothetical protein R6V53_01165 [Candidatus Woesearchaeota archaeon]